MQRTWKKVTKREPCPICKKGDWCGRSDDGEAVICMRAENDHPTKNGGYLYVWRDGAWRSPEKRLFTGSPYSLPPPPPKPPRIARNWVPTPKRLTAQEVIAFVLGDMRVGAWEFGVADICGDDGMYECCTATAFGLYESKSHENCAGILMRDAGGDAVGVRFRNVLTKAKTSLYGGSDGLFFDWKIFSRKVETLYIVEGATDAICLASIGFDVVGRSSCATGTEQIKQLIGILKPRNLVFVSDNDHAKEIAGKMREAGRDGAYKLAFAVGKPFKMISPLNTKDIRDYILKLRKCGKNADFCKLSILQLVKDAKLQNPSRARAHTHL